MFDACIFGFFLGSEGYSATVIVAYVPSLPAEEAEMPLFAASALD